MCDKASFRGSDQKVNVVLINPPSPYLENDAAYPPMGLLYVAASFIQAGAKVELIDCTTLPGWDRYLKDREFPADTLFGLTCTTPNVSSVRQVIGILQKSDRRFMVGGAHPSFLPSDTIDQTHCDFVVRGEIEDIAGEIVRDFKERRIRRVYVGLAAAHFLKPARDLVDLNRYTPGGEPASPVYTSRGCPYACSFCSKFTGTRYREIPIPQILQEIRDVKDQGIKSIVFGDDNFGVYPQRLMEVLKAIEPEGITFRMNCDTRHVDKEIMEYAASCGCTEVSFGVESGNQRMLDAMNKRATVGQAERAIQTVQKSGMKAKAYFMVNFPGEDEDSVMDTLQFADRTRPDKWLLSSFAPLPGSAVFDDPKQYGITWMSRNWDDFYLVGKGGKAGFCFATKDLGKAVQERLHDRLYNGLKYILG